MKRLSYILISAAGLLLFACGEKTATDAVPGKPTLADMETQVKLLEDSLQKGQLDMGPKSPTGVRYAERCMAIYKAFPKSPEAPKYLDRAHMIYTSIGSHALAVLHAEALIAEYPNYGNRQMVLQSLATSYDMFIIPRNKEKVKKYYEMLLKENPDLPAEEKESYQFRLDHLDLTYEELIILRSQKAGNQ